MMSKTLLRSQCKDRKEFKDRQGCKDPEESKATEAVRDPQDPPDPKADKESRESRAPKDRQDGRDLQGRLRTVSLTEEVLRARMVRTQRLISAELYKGPCRFACNFVAERRPSGHLPTPLSHRERWVWNTIRTSSRLETGILPGIPGGMEVSKVLRVQLELRQP